MHVLQTNRPLRTPESWVWGQKQYGHIYTEAGGIRAGPAKVLWQQSTS